jgi:hypothetical protein
MSHAQIRHDGIDFRPASTVLSPVANAKTLEAARLQSGRLKTLRAELDEIQGGTAAPQPDGALLERLRQEEAEGKISPTARSKVPPSMPPEASWRRWNTGPRRFWKLVERFLKWLARLLFSAGTGLPGGGTNWMVAILVITILAVLAAAAVIALRRSKGIAAASRDLRSAGHEREGRRSALAHGVGMGALRRGADGRGSLPRGDPRLVPRGARARSSARARSTIARTGPTGSTRTRCRRP